MKHILRCESCGNYTLKEACSCGGRATTTRPVKYSPQDKFAEWRRKAKVLMMKEKGLM